MTNCRKQKRKPGGQPGNRNARKHGFYAAGLTEAEIGRFWDAVINGGLAPEVAALRIKLDAALGRDPVNCRVRRDAARLLARLYRARYGLDDEESAAFRKVIRGLLELAANDETNRTRTAGNAREMTKRIETEKSLVLSSAASEGAEAGDTFFRNESASEGAPACAGPYPPDVCGKATSV